MLDPPEGKQELSREGGGGCTTGLKLWRASGCWLLDKGFLKERIRRPCRRIPGRSGSGSCADVKDKVAVVPGASCLSYIRSPLLSRARVLVEAREEALGIYV